MDTCLSYLDLLFKLHRTDVPEGRVSPNRVVPPLNSIHSATAPGAVSKALR